MNVASQWYSGTEDETRNNSYKNLETFDVLLSRYRRVLYQVAYRVLDNHEESEDAVRNCLRAASYNAPRFESEGAFRSWLLRALIDEALAILHRERIRLTTSPGPVWDMFTEGLWGQEQTSCS
jgi:DNA-directed RNA polymerase specialized sigma24 family protein